jgi:hypothetical protein
MNRKEVHIIAKAYLERNALFESNHNVGIARSRDSFIKKYCANRSRQLGTFLTDALSLKDIIFDEEIPCDNPRFASGAVEYYSLDLVQLENYFAYRTLIKRGEVPTNNHANFLVLYLMEIVNGIYGNEYEAKRKKLNSVSTLYPKGAKYRSLLQEAYEILYLQNISFLNKEDYFSGVNFPLFKDTSLTDNTTGASNIPIEEIFKFVKVEKFTATNAKDKFILRDCFEYLYKEINDDDFEIGPYKNLDDLFLFNSKLSIDTPLNKLKSYFPITTNITYTNKNGHQEVIADGMHLTKKLYYDDFKLFQINKYFTMVINSIQYNCAGIPLPKKHKEKNSVLAYFERNEGDKPDVQKIVDGYVRKWVAENPYSRKGYLSSLETMKDLKERGSFKLDISDVSKVRKQSSDIQDKLIIDDGDSTPILIPKKPLNKFVEHSFHEDDADAYFKKLKGAKSKTQTPSTTTLNDNNTFITLVRLLSQWEREIIRLIYNGEIDGAEDIAANHAMMLSLAIDKINTKSNSLIDDVVIIDNELVEDYKEELMEALS